MAVAASLLLLVFAGPARAATIVVPTDRPTIQAGIDAAAAGDVVLVEPGEYTERVRVGPGRDGITLAAADPDDPPALVGAGGRGPALRIDRANDVTIDGVEIRDVAEAVRVTNARGVRIVRLGIEDVGTGVRLRRVVLGHVEGGAIVGVRARQAIRIDRSRDVVVQDVLVDDTRRDGVLVRRSTGVAIVGATVRGVGGRSGIAIVRSPDTVVSACDVRGNARDGIRVQRSGDIGLHDNRTDENGDTGLRVERSHPIFGIGDLVAGGNHATANRRREMFVVPPRCGRRRCARGTSTTTTRPASSTSTTVTTTTAPATAPPPLPTTTSMTTTTGPLATVQWRLYVRFTDAHGRYHDVDVPYRSIQPPLAVRIRPGDVTAFRVGDQVTAAEIAALGGDTLARLVNGARAHVAARPAEYPEAAGGAMTLRWAKRDS